MTTVSALCRRAAVCLMAVVLIVGVYSGVAVKAAEELDAKITVSYDLQEDFDMIFNCKIYTSGSFSDVKLKVDFAGKTTEIKKADFSDPSTGLYRFTFHGVSAAEMTTIAKATLYAKLGSDTYKSSTYETSVKSYAMSMLNYYSKSADDKVKKQCTAIVDMLNYGAAAQVYFNKNTNNLANKDLTAAQKKMASSLSASPATCYSKTDLASASASIEKIALSFENPVDFILYAKFADKPSGNVKAQISYEEDSGSTKTLSVASSAFEYQEADRLYRIEFKDFPVKYLRNALTIVLKDGSNNISSTVTYSCESYVKAILDGNFDNNVKDLVKKMLVYGDSAKAYAATLPSGCVTYRQFGAMGTYDASKTDNFEDYYALIMAHDYANAKYLPVKADYAAHYYVKYMNPRSYKGALIKTNTDWGNANFTINDQKLGKDSIEMDNRIIQFSKAALSEGHCFLFTVEPSKPFEYKYINPSSGVFLGVDADLSSYPEYPASNNTLARSFKNKTFSKDTTLFEGDFKDKALYVLKTKSVLRYGRNHESGDAGRDQQEVIVIKDTIEKNGKKYGVLDSSTKLQWDWKDIYIIYKFPMDEKTLTVKGGTFTTIANTDNGGYIYRGISVARSNVVLENVKHKLIGEEKRFADDYDHASGRRPTKGRPYMGFYNLHHCAYVTLKGCTFSDHYPVNDGTYDYYAEYAAVLTIEDCKCEPIVFKNSKCTYEDKSGIMDSVKWGTTGTNYIKDIRVKNSSISRIDAHKGTYGLYVSGSTLGNKGVAAIGYGDMTIENTKVRSENFITLRQDFGSYWNGDIYVKGCTWDLGEKNYTKGFIRILYDPTFNVGYDPIIDENGRRYYSTLPKNVYIEDLTIDARNVDLDGGYALYNRGFNVFDQVIRETSVVDEDYLNLKNAPSYEKYAAEAYSNDPDPDVRAQKRKEAIEKWGYPYYFPIKNTENVYVKNLHVIRRKGDPRHTKKIKIYLRNPNPSVTKDWYFFSKPFDMTNANPDPDNPYWDDNTTTYSDEYPTI